MRTLLQSFLMPVLVGLSLSSCAHSIHQVHVSDFSPYSKEDDGKMIRAESEQFVVLEMTGETNYVEEARSKLMAACPDGQIVGITTQFSTSLGFLSWTNKILMQGRCVKRERST